MDTIVIKEIEDGVQPPMGNPFRVYAFAVNNELTWEIDSGMSLAIPNGLTLRLESVGDRAVIGWTMVKGRLKVFATGRFKPKCGDYVATAWLVREDACPVRFLQRDPSGGRIIRGDSQIATSKSEESIKEKKEGESDG